MNLLSKLFKRKSKKTKAIDLSAASDTVLTLILLRVPVKDLIGKCTRVSPQWNLILSQSSFWRDKMDYDGYHFDWPIIAGISVESFKWMALKHCLERNFIIDRFNMDGTITFDSEWGAPKARPLTAENYRIEIPPVFVDGEPAIPPGFEKPIPACIGIHNKIFEKSIIIKLADKGLTDEIMDKFRPTIAFTEMVANRMDCTSAYRVVCSLEADIFSAKHRGKIPPIEHRRYQKEEKDENGRWIAVSIGLRFDQWDDEGWHRVEHEFKDYPAGMRYLILGCFAFGNEGNPADLCGLKLANFSLKALFEKNAPE